MTKPLKKTGSLLGFAALWLASLAGAFAQGDEEKKAPTIFMIGDSTMANKPLSPAQPERGWGQMLPAYFKPEVRIVNLAANGRSSKSFRDEGRWQPALDGMKAGDWVIIQFGHNDEKKQPDRATDPHTTFRENLARYVRETREKGARPILATSVVRRAFAADGQLTDTHGEYITAVRALAAEEKVPLLDLEKRTRVLLLALGPERSKKLFMWIEPGEYDSVREAKTDDTHFNPYGATRVCDLAVEEMRAAAPDLAAWLR